MAAILRLSQVLVNFSVIINFFENERQSAYDTKLFERSDRRRNSFQPNKPAMPNVAK